MSRQHSSATHAVPIGAPRQDATEIRVTGSGAERRTPSNRPTAPDTGARRSQPRAGAVQLPRLLDIHEIAGHLGVTVRHVRRLVAERRIPYVKWGNLLRFDPEEISNWLAERRVDTVVHGRRDPRAI